MTSSTVVKYAKCDAIFRQMLQLQLQRQKSKEKNLPTRDRTGYICNETNMCSSMSFYFVHFRPNRRFIIIMINNFISDIWNIGLKKYSTFDVHFQKLKITSNKKMT